MSPQCSHVNISFDIPSHCVWRNATKLDAKIVRNKLSVFCLNFSTLVFDAAWDVEPNAIVDMMVTGKSLMVSNAYTSASTSKTTYQRVPMIDVVCQMSPGEHKHFPVY